MSETAPFPWDAVLAFAFSVLRWNPDAVWRATPREIAAAAGAFAPQIAPANAGDLRRLMRLFPDRNPATESPDG